MLNTVIIQPQQMTGPSTCKCSLIIRIGHACTNVIFWYWIDNKIKKLQGSALFTWYFTLYFFLDEKICINVRFCKSATYGLNINEAQNYAILRHCKCESPGLPQVKTRHCNSRASCITMKQILRELTKTSFPNSRKNCLQDCRIETSRILSLTPDGYTQDKCMWV